MTSWKERQKSVFIILHWGTFFVIKQILFRGKVFSSASIATWLLQTDINTLCRLDILEFFLVRSLVEALHVYFSVQEYTFHTYD